MKSGRDKLIHIVVLIGIGVSGCSLPNGPVPETVENDFTRYLKNNGYTASFFKGRGGGVRIKGPELLDSLKVENLEADARARLENEGVMEIDDRVYVAFEAFFVPETSTLADPSRVRLEDATPSLIEANERPFKYALPRPEPMPRQDTQGKSSSVNTGGITQHSEGPSSPPTAGVGGNVIVTCK